MSPVIDLFPEDLAKSPLPQQDLNLLSHLLKDPGPFLQAFKWKLILKQPVVTVTCKEPALCPNIWPQRQNNCPPQGWQTGYSQAPWITTSNGKHSGPTQVGVRKSSGFCVISSYFQLPISIAIQTARPRAHNGNIKENPISLSFSFCYFPLHVFHSWVSLFSLPHS